jgi:phosphomethylpyrimidine synthase
MIAPKSAIEPDSSERLPNSSRVYVEGEIYPDIRAPMREIDLAPTKASNSPVPIGTVPIY